MPNIFIRKMIDRIDAAKEDSDNAYFDALMLYGELLTKLTLLYISATITNGKERNRYGIYHKLVRSSGIGDWSLILESILSGKKYIDIIDEVKPLLNDITYKYKKNTWQYDSYVLLQEVKNIFALNSQIPPKASLLDWYKDFAHLRNKTKGHGAHLPGVLSSSCTKLRDSLDLIASNLSILKIESAYLHKNLNGSYRISKISTSVDSFNFLKAKGGPQKYPNGAYVFCNSPRELELIYTDPDFRDFFIPNGQATSGFEVLSYLTGATKIESYEKYSTPPEQLPKSETYGLDGFDVQGNIFSNMPKLMDGYIKRSALEEEISHIILDKRNPVITLSGRGGIGKTTILLSILHKLADNIDLPFDIIIWFSARDIDLKESGPKSVQVAVLTKKDISEQYIHLMQPDQNLNTPEQKIAYFTEQLGEKYENKGKMYIIDNFETLTTPEDIYSWLNTNIELPNKVVITTRHRKFKGDYPVEISGMIDSEAYELIQTHADKLNISNLLTDEARQNIVQLSDGHPYIIKIYLGQIARDKNSLNVKRVIADRDDILVALFDRTFLQLSAAAQRVYLTLCEWNSDVPEVALKAILMRSESTQMDVDSAIDELINFSLIEYKELENDSLILRVPLASRIYGEKKIKSSPYQYIVDDDVKLLHMLGARQNTETVQQTLERLILITNGIISNNTIPLIEKQNVIEYIGKKFPPVLLHAAYKLRNEYRDISRNYTEMFLANENITREDKCTAWELMAFVYSEDGDGTKYVHAKTQYAKSCSSYSDISASANDINRYISENRELIDTIDKRRILSSLAEYMETLTAQWDANDYSRIAWLYMNSGNMDKAISVARKGIEIDPQNSHCRNIIARQGQ